MTQASALPLRHLVFAAFVVVVWGVNFTVIEIALEGFPPILFAALRFALVAVCCLVVPRPKVAWRYLVLVGLFTGTGQYALLFLGMAAGMPPGISSLVLQAQVLLTLLVAATVLRERPTKRQLLGLSIAVVGLVIVGFNRGGTVPLVALLLVLAAAGSWAIGNVCTRIAQPDDGFRLTIWSCLIPPVPLFLLSIATEGADRGLTAIADADITTWLALGYVVVFATILALGVWSMLLGRYPAHKVVPFALLIPVVGIPTGWLVEGDVITLPMLAGALVVLAGLYFVTIRARADRTAERLPVPATRSQ
ncbi:EamA family transporter [Actinokineospora globicatena]|uniref:EamA domain-containing protein n=1 Tax=Actinokineospora globicatena TaxID=103729 RepID=A0A9W6V8E5_9PSEU|nr:EamA family transporter [Actinokineospora globicatena]GLW89868.1 hypothetical protein Aglo03_06840 [Actinokineospora globicatena]